MSFASIFHASKLWIGKRSPEILLGAGLIGMGGTVVLACKATLKSEAIIDRHKELMGKAVEAVEYATPEDNYDIRVEKVAIWKHTIGQFTKLYAPAIGLGLVSLTAILFSHKIIRGRYLGAVAAFNATNAVFNKYRERVVDELGKEADHRFRYGTEKISVDSKEVDEKGKTKTTKKDITMADEVHNSEFSRWFIEGNRNWDRDPRFNRLFLEAKQQMANDMLTARGHLFLNEVYDILGFKRTQAGSVVGWIKKRNGNNDGFVDFGIMDYRRKGNKEFINEETNEVLLDFNVDGVIWDLIEADQNEREAI